MNAADQEIARLKRELDETKQALEDAQSQIQGANRLKAQFLATMSHELRTPMNAIIGFTRLVLRRGSEQLSNRNRENLEKVKLSADHLLALINDRLDITGARWSLQGAEAVLKLRSLKSSGDYEASCFFGLPFEYRL